MFESKEPPYNANINITQSQSTLLNGLISNEDLKKEYRKRSTQYITKTIAKQDIEPFLKEGWERVPSRRKKIINLRKPKEVGSAFEDEVWCIFYRMGFIEMNKGNNFTIPRFKSDVTKQIDVFAREDQCICIVECKASDKPHTKRSLEDRKSVV